MNDQLPEAPSSISLTLKTPKGFPAILTVRDHEVERLIKRIVILEDSLLKEGFVPAREKRTFATPESKDEQRITQRDELCPTCKSPTILIEGVWGRGSLKGQPYKLARCESKCGFSKLIK